MLLFINGYTRGCEALRPYWSSSKKDPDEFINAARIYFDDDHISDFSFINGSGNWFGSMAWSRKSYGKKYALKILDDLIPLLKQGETIKIVSHSMGAATAEGIIEVLNSAGLTIQKVIHLCPSSANKITFSDTTNHIQRLQLNATGDKVIEEMSAYFLNEKKYRIPQIELYGRVKWDPWAYHKIHMDYIVSKKKPFKLDSHFDLKTYAYIFDWVSDLEEIIKKYYSGGAKDYSEDKINYEIKINYNKGTRFQNLYIDGNYLKYIDSPGFNNAVRYKVF